MARFWSGWKTVAASTVNTLPYALAVVGGIYVGTGRGIVGVLLVALGVGLEFAASNAWMLAYRSMVTDAVKEALR